MMAEFPLGGSSGSLFFQGDLQAGTQGEIGEGASVAAVGMEWECDAKSCRQVVMGRREGATGGRRA